MKILYAAHARMPTEKAYGAQIAQMCSALAERALVTLIVPERNKATADNIRIAYDLPDALTIRVVDTPDLVRFGPIGFWMSEWFFARAVRNEVAAHTYDVVYSRDELPLLRLPQSLTTIYEMHTPRWNVFVRRVLRSVTIRVSITKGLRAWYEKKGITEPIEILPDAVDLDRFGVPYEKERCRREIGIPADHFMVSYVGHLYREKGAHILAEAVQFLPEDVHCLFVGGLADDAQTFQERYGKDDRITCVPHQSHERVPYYLGASDILVLPNSSTSETAAQFTSPMKLFEYMAACRPIIASDVPALREVLTNDTATFFEADSAADLAARIVDMRNNPANAQEQAVRARAEVEQYTWSKRAARIIEMI